MKFTINLNGIAKIVDKSKRSLGTFPLHIFVFRYGRHSNSIDLNRHRCGQCQGMLEFKGKFRPDGTPMKPRKQTQYQIFVKKHFSTIKKRKPTFTNAQVMKMLGEMYRDKKNKTSINFDYLGKG